MNPHLRSTKCGELYCLQHTGHPNFIHWREWEILGTLCVLLKFRVVSRNMEFQSKSFEKTLSYSIKTTPKFIKFLGAALIVSQEKENFSNNLFQDFLSNAYPGFCVPDQDKFSLTVCLL